MSRASHIAVAAAGLVLTACVPTPENYPVPPQHPALTAPPPLAERGIMSVEDPRSDAFFVQDVNCSRGADWCWTGQNPQLRFRLVGEAERRAMVQFVVSDRTFRETGPLRVNFFVNGHLLSNEIYSSPGEKKFEKPVPKEWMKPDGDNDILLQIENAWTAPDDGVKLGVLLRRAGFLQ